MPSFGMFGAAARDDAMAALWSPNPPAMLWPEMGAVLVASAVDLPVLLLPLARGIVEVRIARQVARRRF